jgi:hypothetical protein
VEMDEEISVDPAVDSRSNSRRNREEGAQPSQEATTRLTKMTARQDHHLLLSLCAPPITTRAVPEQDS